MMLQSVGSIIIIIIVFLLFLLHIEMELLIEEAGEKERERSQGLGEIKAG